MTRSGIPSVGPALSRRSFLRAAGLGAGALSLSALLAACGDEGGGGTKTPEAYDWSSKTQAGTVTFVNWPLYIDQAKVNGEVVHPTLEAFTDSTKIEVDYEDLIQDYASFFGKIAPQLRAGQATGYDLVVMGYPKWLPLMISREYLVPLDPSYLQNFKRHAAQKYKEAPYDPGNVWSIPYQSGITGIGYNIEMIGRELTSVQELFNPAFEGKVGMFRDTEDTPNMALIASGVNPPDATEDDWQKAADLLIKQRDDRIVRQYFGQGYIGALQSGEVALSLAWSADVLQSINAGYDNLRFIVPDEGGLLWTDSMCIPFGAEHPVDAIMLMDHFFRPQIAAMLTSWIQNVSPVPEAQQILRDQGDPVADNPLVFPTEEMYARMRGYRVLEGEEQDRWDDLFLAIYQA
jgi:spermidine/putrescine transport system substrate-binding protein